MSIVFPELKISKLVNVILAALALHAAGVSAQAGYPAKPIQFVVPYPPGGSNDLFARAVGKRLAEALGQPVVIDNRAGAGGSLGAALVAKAAPDGYTLAIVSSSFTTNAAIQSKLPFDPVGGFSAVALVGKGPLVLAASSRLGLKSPQEFLALARARPGSLNYATSGAGSINHFATELLKVAAGLNLTHVPYKGMGPAVNDLVGGHVDLIIASAPSVMSQVKAGKVTGIAVTSEHRSPVVPELPALAESGIPGYSVELWWGVLAPAGVPKDVVARLNAEINAGLASPEMKAFLLREGAESSAASPEAFAGLIRTEIGRWRKVAKDANIQPE
jgi:tripartite-type tricarboxylate transporter receptor subunit TctC